MGESRDAKDPRDLMRGMSKETRAEFERDEADDTGGQEHASRADREGLPAGRRPVETTRDVTRSTREQSGADALRVPRGGTGAGGDAAGGAPLQHGGEPPPEE